VFFFGIYWFYYLCRKNCKNHMATTLNYVDIDNLRAFWAKAKEYIDNQISGTNATITALSGKVDGEIARSTGKDTEHTNAIAEIKSYTVNGIAISSTPVLTSENISLGKTIYNKTADTSLYDFFQTLVLNIELYKTYVNSHTDSGGHKAEKITLDPIINSNANVQEALTDLNTRLSKEEAKPYVSTVIGSGKGGVTVTPSQATSGAVTVEVDATSLSNKITALENKAVVTSVVATDGTYVKLTPDEKTSGEISIVVNDNAVGSIAADVNTIKGYKVNDKPISGNPVLNGLDILVGGTDTHSAEKIGASIEALYAKTINGVTIGGIVNATEIPYSKDDDTTTTYAKINSIDQALSGVKGSYVKSIVGSGTGVTVTPDEATNGEVTITVDASAITNKLATIDAYKINAKPISGSPTLAGDDITLGVSVGDNTNYPTDQTISTSIQKILGTIAGLGQVMELRGVESSLPGNTTGYGNGDVIIVKNKEYVCCDNAWYLLGDTTELGQDVSTIKASYVKSITDVDGTYVKLSRNSATGDVTITVDDSGITTALAGKSDDTHNHNGVYVPVGRKVNNKALSADITLGAGDVGAVPTTRTVNGYPLSDNVTLDYDDVGAAPASHSHNMSHISDYGTYVYDATVTRTKNTVLAAPSDKNGVASFRALVAADIPPHSHNKAEISDYTDTKNTAGSTNSAEALYLIGAKSQAANAQTYSNSAVRMTGGSITANDFITTSDRRLKKNIVEVTDEMLEKSLGLNVYEFDYRNTGEHSVGYIAQDVQEVLPVMVQENKCSDGEEFLAVKYTPIHTMQIKALNNKVNQLTTENKELKERLEKLEKLMEKLM
jgi:hypothetical protein